MQRHVLGTTLVIGSLLVGCGVQPVMPSLAPAPIARSVAQAAKSALTVKSVLMPPLEVFKTADDNNKTFLTGLKSVNTVKWSVISPVMSTTQISQDGAKVGYLVTVHGNASIVPTNGDKTPAEGAFLITYLIDAKGTLSYTNTLTSFHRTGRDQDKPLRVMSTRVGDIFLKVPTGDKLPQDIADRITALNQQEQAAISGRFPGLTLQPTTPDWWLFGTAEIWVKDRMVGYYNDPAAWMYQDKDNVDGVAAQNFLDPTGARIAAQGFSVATSNMVGYHSFDL